MYSLDPRVSSSRWSSSCKLLEYRKRGSRRSDSWSSCGTSGKDSGYQDRQRRKKRKNRETVSQNLMRSSLIPPPFCLLLHSSPFLLLYTPHSGITDTHLLLSLHSARTDTHTRSGDLHLAVLLPVLQSQCIRDCMCVCVCGIGRERVGWWVDGWVKRKREEEEEKEDEKGVVCKLPGKVQSWWATSSANTLPTCPPQTGSLDTELLHNLNGFGRPKRGGELWNNNALWF